MSHAPSGNSTIENIPMRILFQIILLSSSMCGPLRAQLSNSDQEQMAAMVRESFAVSETVNRIQNNEIPQERLRIIAAILRNTKEVEIHRMRGANENKVYLHPEGKQEAVYDADGKLVKDGINDGSYNYFHPHRDAPRHFTFDIAPWLLFGQSPKDPTTVKERVHAYAADVFAGVARARQAKLSQGELEDVAADEMGNAEAIAIFLAAMERGNAEEMIEIFESHDEINDQEVALIVKKFEAGLYTLVSNEKRERD